MAIFTRSFTSGYDPAYESYSIEVGGGTDALIEGFSDELAVIEAMHAYDMAEIELMKKVKAIHEGYSNDSISDAEAEYQYAAEASLKEIWAKIKAWFKKLWEKVKAFFASIVKFFAAAFLSPKAFINKYRTQLNNLKSINFKYTTYPYAIVKDPSGMIKVIQNAIEPMKVLKKEADKIANAMYADSISDVKGTMGDNKESKYNELLEDYDELIIKSKKDTIKAIVKSDIEPDELTDALYELYRGGREQKEITVTNVKQWIELIDNSDKLVNEMKKFNDTVNSTYKELNDAIEKYAAKAESNNTSAGSKVAGVMRKAISANSGIQSVVNSAASIYTKVVKEAAGVGKAICAKALSPKSSKK